FNCNGDGRRSANCFDKYFVNSNGFSFTITSGRNLLNKIIHSLFKPDNRLLILLSNSSKNGK
ncbi:unnamed protein product, partial [Rotaria sp. Silwood2]